MVDNGWDQVLNGRFDQIQEDGCRMFHVKKLICNFQLKSTFSWCLPTTGYVKRLNEIFPSYMGALTWKNSSRLSFVKIWLTSFWARLLQNELHTTHYKQCQCLLRKMRKLTKMHTFEWTKIEIMIIFQPIILEKDYQKCNHIHE